MVFGRGVNTQQVPLQVVDPSKLSSGGQVFFLFVMSLLSGLENYGCENGFSYSSWTSALGPLYFFFSILIK